MVNKTTKKKSSTNKKTNNKKSKETHVRVTKKTATKLKKNQNSLSKKIMGNSGFIGLAIIIIAVIVAAVLMPNNVTDNNSAMSGSGEVVLDMYVMSQCPYGVQAENEAIKAVKRFGGDVDYNINFIVNSVGDSFQSLHGPAEVDENLRQVCIEKNYLEKHLDYLSCFNANYQSGESSYESCAQQLGIDESLISTCVEDEGVDLLKASEAKSKEVGATGSPTIYLDGEPYGSGRSELDFARAICDKFDYEHPGCADIPKPVDLKVKVLTDDDCPTCDTGNIIAVSKQLFPGAEFEMIDVDSDEGQALVDENELVYLPAYFFEQKLVETNSWQTNEPLKSAFLETTDGFRLRDEATGAAWFIDKEKQAEFFQSIGVVKGDNKPQMDFFVMSYCPYGNQAEEAIAPVYEQLKEEAEFKPHYVIYSNYGSGYPDYCLDEENVLCSMHGIQEIHQDIREACVLKYYGSDEWFSFALAMNQQCTSQNADTCWTTVAESLELDTDMISTCETDEGYDLMLADKTLGDQLGVKGSPTVFVEGMQYAGSRTANGFLSGICSGFEDAPSECDSVVTEPTQAAAAPTATC